MRYGEVLSTACAGILTFRLPGRISSIGGGVNDLLGGGVCGEISVAIGVTSTFVSSA